KDYHLFDDFSPAEPTYNKQLHLLVSNSRYPDRWPGDGGLTLLHVAALDYDAAMVQRLLKSGFPSDLEDERGRTAYDIALKKSPALAALFPEHAERGGTAGAEAVKRASECTDKALIPESQMERYRAMVAAGALTFCEAD
ncbi:MAG: ankyrin repeat domain-containing protein, partial [Pseudomonadota bacterium]